MSSVRLEHVSKKFQETVAVDDVSFKVDPKEFFTMLGPSGCGKTTLLRMMAGFISPTKGDVYIADQPVTGVPPQRRKTGMVFQSYALFPHMTVYENLAYGPKMKKFSGTQIATMVRETLELVRLSGFEKRYPRELSGGQQQRIALARAIVVQPDVLLLDEPLSNLDYKLRMAMRGEIKKIQRNTGITTVFVTHDQGEALTMSDRIVVLNKGKTMQVGTPTDIYESPANKFTADFIGEANFFEGTVVQSDGSMAEISLDGVLLRASIHEEHESPKPGDKASVSIRPERIRILPHTAETRNKKNMIEGVVEERQYLGSVIRYTVRIDPQLTIRIEEKNLGERLHSQGENVYLECRPDDCFVLASE